jgi:hypothetical protein
MKAQAALILTFAILFWSCTRPDAAKHSGQSPDEVVKSFVKLSVNSNDFKSRTELQHLCVGEMRRTFERMNEEAFKLIYLDNKLTLRSFEITQSSINANSAKVQYQVVVDNLQGTDPTREVNKREVELSFSQGAWFIENIRITGSDQVAFTRGMIF